MSDTQETLTPAEQSERSELMKAYGEVFRSASGKLVLFDILEMCGMYDAAFTGDNNATNFRLGTQEAGKRMIARLNEIDARFYPQLLLTIAELREMNKAATAANKGQEDNDIDA